MSFTIPQRTREIGIRSALGAPPRQLLLGIFGRAMRQIGIGAFVGSLLLVAAVMTVVAALAALGRRGGVCGSRRSRRCGWRG